MTLSETLATIFILCLIGTLIVGIYLSYENVYKMQIAYNELTINNTIAIDRISSNTKGSSRVMATKTINSTDYTTDYKTLILELPSINSSQNIISGSFDYIVYFLDPLDSTKLKSDSMPATGSVRPGGQQSVGNFVSTIVFNYNNIDYPNVNKIEIIIADQKTVKGQAIETVSQTTAELRNK